MDAPAEEALPEKDTTIRLSLSDLFVWMTLTGLFCFLSREYLTSTWQSEPYLIWNIAPALLIHPVSLTAFMMMIRRRLRRQPMHFQPGYWLLCLNGILACFVIESAIVGMLFPQLQTIDMDFYGPRPWKLLVPIAQNSCILIAVSLAGFGLPVRWFWRIVLLVPLLESGRYILYDLMYLLRIPANLALRQFERSYSNLESLLALLLIVILAVVDVSTTDQKRDWLHWLGVILTLLLYTVAALYDVLEMLAVVSSVSVS